MYARCSVVKSHIQGTEANVGFCQQQCTKLQKNSFLKHLCSQGAPFDRVVFRVLKQMEGHNGRQVLGLQREALEVITLMISQFL